VCHFVFKVEILIDYCTYVVSMNSKIMFIALFDINYVPTSQLFSNYHRELMHILKIL
jgi:hypothetical protein